MTTHGKHTAQRAGKLMAGALAVSLAASGTPLAPALAATQAEEAQAAGETEAAESDGDAQASSFSNELDETGETSGADSANLSARDITDEWAAGACTLRDAGTYVLSRDIANAGTLSIEAPAGQTITLDLQGHRVECAAGMEAAIELGNSKGKVVVTDSARADALSSEKDGVEKAGGAARARLVVHAAPAQDQVAGISFAAPEAQGETKADSGQDADVPEVEISHVTIEVNAAADTNDADGAQIEDSADDQSAREQGGCVYGVRVKGADATAGAQGEGSMPHFTLSDCSINVDGTPETQAGEDGGNDDASEASPATKTACAIDVDGARLALDGEMVCKAQGAEHALELHLAEADSLSLNPGVSLPETLRVEMGGACAGAVLAKGAEDNEIDAECAKKFESADAAWKLAVSEDRKSLVFASAQATYDEADKSAAGRDEDATSEEDAGSSKTAATDGSSRVLELHAAGEGGMEADAETPSEGTNADAPGRIRARDLLAAAATGTSLNELMSAWTANPDNGSDFTIDKGGVYRLDEDLATSCRIVVKAPGQNVVFKLCGHALSIDTQSIGYGIDIQSAAKVTIDGSGGESSAIRFSGDPLLAAVRSAADTLVANDIDIEASSRQTRLSSLSGACIAVVAGTLEATRVKARLDQSNQSVVSNTSAQSFYGAPAAFSIGTDAGTATFFNCTAATIGSPCVAPGSSPDAEIGYAYALRAQTAAQVTVNGGSWSAQVANGTAVAASARNLLVTGGETAFSACGATRAACLESTAANGVKVDAKLSFSFAGPAEPALAAGFSTNVEGGFTFTGNADFPATGALVETGGGQNLPDAVLAHTDGADAAALAAKLENALGEASGCDAGANGSDIVFHFDQTRAAAEVRTTAGQTTRYATLSQAIEAMQDGDTLVLLADADDISFAKAGNARMTFIIDMNGKTAASLAHSSACALSVVSSAGRGRIEAAPKTGTAVSLSTSATLVLSGIDVVNQQAASSACGIEATGAGTLELDDVNVEVSAQTGIARAIRLGSAQGSLVARGSSIKASTACPGVSVRGVQAAANTSCEISATNIEVQGASTSAIGIESSGAVSFAGEDTDSPARLSVRTSQAASSVACIDLTQAAAKAIVKNASLELLAGGTAASSAVLMAGAQTASVAATWVLDATVDFSGNAAVHISHTATPLRIGPTFRSAASITVASTQLSGKIFAQAASESDLALDGSGAAEADSSIEPAASSFTATGDYANWTAQTEQDAGGTPSRLRWTRAAVAYVESGAQIQGYETLAEAFAAAADGDTVELAADTEENQQVSCDKQVVFDLHGHTACLSVVGAAGRNGAISYAGTKTFTIRDSAAGTGALEIELGANPETASSAKSAYRGIAVTGGGRVVLDGAAMRVSYTGSTLASTAPTPTVQGVGVVNGSFSMEGASVLQVKASAGAGGFGANTATGVYTQSAAGGSCVEVGENARIEVDNAAAASTSGSFQVLSPGASNSSAQPAYVVQIFPDTSSDFYREICEKFTEQARFDDAAEDGDYSSEIYYCTPLTLDDGTYVWAYSDPVDTAGRGHLASIVPTRFFVQCGKEVPTSAWGIQSAEAFCGTVKVDGAVDASCAHGDAYALDAKGASTWEAGANVLSESHGDEEHLLEGSRMDMRDYFDLGSRYTEPVYLPKNGAAQVARVRACTGGAARVDAKAKVAIGGVEVEESTEKSVDAKDDGIHGFGDEKRAQTWGAKTVAIAFDNVRDASGNASRIEAATTAPYLSTLAEAGIQVPAPADYTLDDGTVMRFVGWCAANNSDNYVYAADELADKVVLNGSVSGASSGSVVFSAHYVPVGAGEHLVSFKVDATVLAYAVADGTRPSYVKVAGNARAATPAKVDSETGCYYSFAGWTDASGQTWWTLPAASADAVYTAGFSTEQSLVSLTFTYRDANGVERSKSESVEFDTDVNARAAQLVQAGDVVKTPETIYTFTGFGPRKTDVEPYYQDGALPSMRTDSFWRYSNVYYAKYDSAARTVDVQFMDGDTVYAATDAPVATGKLLNEVLSECGKKAPTAADSTQSFLGWSKTKDATTPDVEKVNSAKLSTLVDSDSDTVVLYAVYGKAQPASVEFYDAEAFPDNMGKDTLLYTLSVEQGQSIDEAFAAAKKSAPVPTKGGKYFAGWVDASGNAVSFADAVKANMKLFATYKDVTVLYGGDAADNFTLDLSGLLVGEKGIEKAEKVVVSIERVTAADRTLSSLVAGGLSYSPMLNAALKSSIYSLRLYYVKDGKVCNIESGFGKIAVKAKVPASFQSSKTRAFWVGGDGMAYTKVSQNSAQIAFAVRHLGYVEDGYGNLVIGIAANSSESKKLVPSIIDAGDATDANGTQDSEDDDGADTGDEEKKSDLTPSTPTLPASTLPGGGSLPTIAGATLAPASAALAPALAAGVAGAQALGQAAADALGGEAASAQSSSEVESMVDVGQDGNMAGLAVIAAAFAALFARLAFFLVGRRKKDDETADEAPMPVEETVRF